MEWQHRASIIENTRSKIAPVHMHMSAYGIGRPGVAQDMTKSRTPLKNSITSLVRILGKFFIIATSGCMERYGMAFIRILPEM
jgi:hypothetical protein